ncbi:unnamed protein product [Aphanomyces euteiches]
MPVLSQIGHFLQEVARAQEDNPPKEDSQTHEVHITVNKLRVKHLGIGVRNVMVKYNNKVLEDSHTNLLHKRTNVLTKYDIGSISPGSLFVVKISSPYGGGDIERHFTFRGDVNEEQEDGGVMLCFW